MEQNKALRMLGLATRAGKISFGTESVIDTITKKKSKLVIVALNASERTKRNIEKTANECNVKMRIYETIETLSKSIGKENKAVISINDINFANEILKIIDGGEVIG
ncbi:MAG: 50S ribosomal protein L7ae [Clostridia bacterium]|nr:50S ribosomal protein L7ae [Clostridia bacterium]